MIPSELKMFWPFIRPKLLTALETKSAAEMGVALASAVREEFAPVDQQKLGQALAAAAAELTG